MKEKNFKQEIEILKTEVRKLREEKNDLEFELECSK